MQKDTAVVDAYREALLRMGPDPNSWPLWPVLPVKSRTKKEASGIPQLGYLFEQAEGEPLRVRDGNIYAPKADDPIIATYSSWQEMVADGWVVD